MDLDSVAAGLYGLKPGEFVPARDARAVEARRDGNKELAAAIKKLKRPSVSAWLANALVRERPQDVERLLELGQRLQEAQQQLAGEQLRILSQQRRQVVSTLVNEAVGVGSDHDQPISAAARRELQETLEAALSDPAAANAFREGRLITALSYTGLGTQGLGPPRVDASGGQPTDGPQAQAAVREAEAALSTAGRRRDQQREELTRAERDRDRLARRIEELTEQLEDLRAQLSRAEKSSARLAEQLDASDAEVSAAERRLTQARRAGNGSRSPTG